MHFRRGPEADSPAEEIRRDVEASLSAVEQTLQSHVDNGITGALEQPTPTGQPLEPHLYHEITPAPELPTARSVPKVEQQPEQPSEHRIARSPKESEAQFQVLPKAELLAGFRPHQEVLKEGPDGTVITVNHVQYI